MDLASGKTRKRMVGGHGGAIRTLVFSADSKRLVSGSSDTTALVWDLCSYPGANSRSKSLSSADFNRCWSDLASQDAGAAHHAICHLADAADDAILLMRERLHPTLEADPRVVASWIAELDKARLNSRRRRRKPITESGEVVWKRRAASSSIGRALVRIHPPEVLRRLDRISRVELNRATGSHPQNIFLHHGHAGIEVMGTRCFTRRPRAARTPRHRRPGGPPHPVCESFATTTGAAAGQVATWPNSSGFIDCVHLCRWGGPEEDIANSGRWLQWY